MLELRLPTLAEVRTTAPQKWASGRVAAKIDAATELTTLGELSALDGLVNRPCSLAPSSLEPGRDFIQSACRSAAGWFVDLISETVQRRWRPRLASGGVLRCASCS